MSRNKAISICIVILVATVIVVSGVYSIGTTKDGKNNNSIKALVTDEGNKNEAQISLKYATTTLPTDFSILERDTIYGEEEGKFMNLPLEGQALLISLLAIPGCDISPEGTYCYENDWTVESGSIIAFKDGVLLYSVANGKGGTNFSVFDTKQSTTTFKLSAVGQGLRNSRYILTFATLESPLMYYKVGMRTFGEIPESRTTLVMGEQYSPSDYVGDIQGRIEGDIVVVSIFSYNLDDSRFNKVREVSFDLKKLP